MKRGLIVAFLHLLLVSSLGGKLLLDRRMQPREWAKAEPYDPNLPIRGRYVSLRIRLQPRDSPQPVLYFIPEHAADPSRRPPGEELWVEVTIPKKGPPRPIRLGVKKDGVITPLNLD